MFDIDGCLALFGAAHDGGVALPGAAAAVEAVRASGRGVVAFTNASNNPPWTIAASLRELGIPLADDDVLTPAVVAAEVIAQRYRGRPVLAFGGPGLLEVLQSDETIDLAGPDDSVEAAAVVIGWDTAFGRDQIQRAAEALWAGADLLVTSAAPSFASHGLPIAGVSGFIAHGLRHVAGAEIEIVGKPSTTAMGVIARRLGVPAARLLVVGDDLTLETRMAKAAGAIAVLTTTGTHDARDAAAAPVEERPDLVVAGLPDLLALWAEADVGGAA